MKLLKTVSTTTSTVIEETGSVLVTAARTANKAVEYLENEVNHALLVQQLEHEKELAELRAENPDKVELIDKTVEGWQKQS